MWKLLYYNVFHQITCPLTTAMVWQGVVIILIFNIITVFHDVPPTVGVSSEEIITVLTLNARGMFGRGR